MPGVFIHNIAHIGRLEGRELKKKPSSAPQSLPSCFKTQGRGPPAEAGSAQADYPKYFSMQAPGLSEL